MKILLLFVALTSFGYVFTGCASPSVAEEETPLVRADPVQTLKEAAAFYKNRGEIAEARKAVETLSKARDPEKRNFEVEWTYAQYSYFLGSRKTIDDTEAEKVLKKGLSAATIAKRLIPKRPEGHFWYAAILGEQSKRSPVTVGVISVDKIRKAMNKVIEIDPSYQGASAYDGLGQLEMGSRGMAGGSAEKAVEYFEKAYELNRENSYIHLHLGEAYLAVDRDAEAKKHLEYVLSMKSDPDFVPEHEECKLEARKLLDTKF